jgi:poly [ADP-ribose] polymerase
MFGKGVYFADSCSKSGNYCNARIGDRGFLALSQVALGNIQEKINGDYEAGTKRPDDIHSTLGVGINEPAKRGSKKM